MSEGSFFAEIKLKRIEFGEFKLRLLPENESLWAVAADHQENAIRNDPNMDGELFFAYLLNQPVTWDYAKWGTKVVVKNNGHEMPTVALEDQTKENFRE